MQELSLKSVVTGLIEQCIQIITNAIKKYLDKRHNGLSVMAQTSTSMKQFGMILQRMKHKQQTSKEEL